MGKSPKDAAVDGISEVRLAVLAITFMLCVALVPLAFSGGIVQFMFEGIVWAIILALLSSALVSFTLTALLASNRPMEIALVGGVGLAVIIYLMRAKPF